MIAWRLFDRLRGGLIQLSGLLLLAAALAVSGCPEHREGGRDSGSPGGVGRPAASPATGASGTTSASAAAGAGDDAGTGPDGADAPAATVAADEPGSGGDGAWLVLRARGRARAGRDVDLARQAAAAAARTNLAKLLKKKGLLEPGDPHLDGAVIERYFRRGRYLYAVAAISVAKSEPADLNVPRPAASKSTGAEGKTSRNPGNHGGEQ